MRPTVALPDQVAARGLALQARLLPDPPFIAPCTPESLYKDIRKNLTRASNEGHLADPLEHIFKNLRFSESGREFTIHGARLERANFRRSRGLPHFTRADGAWFDFLITGRVHRTGCVEILAYDCEVRFPELPGFPQFIRFDLNPPGHANEQPGLRCHCHPGHDDLQVATAFIEPLEMIDMCVYGLAWPNKPRQPESSPTPT